MAKKDNSPRSIGAIAKNRAKAKLGVYSSGQKPLISKERKAAIKRVAENVSKSAVVGKKKGSYKLRPTTKF